MSQDRCRLGNNVLSKIYVSFVSFVRLNLGVLLVWILIWFEDLLSCLCFFLDERVWRNFGIEQFILIEIEGAYNWVLLVFSMAIPIFIFSQTIFVSTIFLFLVFSLIFTFKSLEHSSITHHLH